ncbi:MAG TPA: helix-turn-helix domain-containing protein [Bacteroidia bacterium]|nr:helix-turn-helix domain-containing protein [Bacteroidia bacterium]
MNHTDNSGCVPYLKALSDETRWEIMRVVANASEPLTLGQIARSLDLSDYNASRHVRILSEAGLVRVVRDGRFKRISVAPEWLTSWQKGKKANPAGRLDLGCCRFDFTEAKPDRL